MHYTGESISETRVDCKNRSPTPFLFFRCQKELPRKVRSRGRRSAVATPIGPILLASAPIGCVLHGAPLEPRGRSGWRPQTVTRTFCHDHLRQLHRVAVPLLSRRFFDDGAPLRSVAKRRVHWPGRGGRQGGATAPDHFVFCSFMRPLVVGASPCGLVRWCRGTSFVWVVWAPRVAVGVPAERPTDGFVGGPWHHRAGFQT